MTASTAAALPDGDFTETFEYDDRGRQTLHVSFEGAVTRHVYDPATGRLSEQQFFDNLTAYDDGNGAPSEVWSNTYDPFGRVAGVTQTAAAGARTLVNTYDAQGRLASVSSPEGVVGYAYDALGRRTQTAVYLAGEDPAAAVPQRTTSFTYDALGRLETVVEDRDAAVATDALLTTTYQYDLVGNLDATLLPSDVIEDYAYDSLNRLETLTSFVDDGTVNGAYDAGSDTLIAAYDYAVRADGKRTGVTETLAGGLTNTFTWGYDNLGRLASETLDSSDDTLDFATTYTFDLTGNRLSRQTDRDGDQVPDETVASTYDANDRLLIEELDADGIAGAEQTTSYTYDHTQQTGKTVTDSASSVTSAVSNTYDPQGRLHAVTTETYTSGSLSRREQVTFDYDAAGHPRLCRAQDRHGRQRDVGDSHADRVPGRSSQPHRLPAGDSPDRVRCGHR